jgi:hypothetical protein
MNPRQVVELFISAINAHDPRKIADLMTADHRLIDSLGAAVEGRDAVLDGWTFYFDMVPDYNIEVSRWFVSEGNEMEAIMVGTARGGYASDGMMRPESSWSTPVALRAIVRSNQVAEWQVYADNEPIREKMRAAQG